MTAGRALALTAAWVVAAGPMVCRAAETYTARLTMIPIDMSMRATVTGSGTARAVLDGRRLVITGSYSGMQGPATSADLRSGPLTGVRGPEIHALQVESAAAGKLSGEIELTPEQIDGLRHGRLYVQIASRSAPEGNLWGWLLAQGSRQ